MLSLAATLAIPPLAAQQLLPRPPTTAAAPVGKGPELLTVTKHVEQVNLIVSVRDRKGRYVADLSRENFQVLDNKLPPQRLEYFQRQTDLPLRLGILIDLSDSVRSEFHLEQQAAIHFLQETLRPDTDSAFIAGFDSQYQVAAASTSDMNELAGAVLRIRGKGSTSLYDAVERACAELSPFSGALQRRAVIIISDGVDNTSKENLDGAIDTALRSEVALYALSTNPPYINESGELAMAKLASATGGRLLQVRRAADFKKAFATLQQELRSQYLIGYTPLNFKHDGAYRRVSVKLRRRSHLSVQARRGYYAPHDPAM